MKPKVEQGKSNSSKDTRIDFCARYAGALRWLLFFGAIFLFSLRPEYAAESLVFKQWAIVFALVVIPCIFMILLVSVFFVEEDTVLQPGRYGPRPLCQLSQVKRLGRISWIVFGYSLWGLEYSLPNGRKKVRHFIPKKKGNDFNTFLAMVGDASPEVVIKE